METARQLFETLTNLKREIGVPKRTPQQRLLEYCQQVLGAVERVRFDFKEKSTKGHAKLEDDDKKNLAKAVSGFANSEGGVVIWGIKDKRFSPEPLADVPQFLSAMLQLAPHLTDPTVPGIDGDWIPADNGTGQDGFPLIYVPESSLPPHRVILNNKQVKNLYYIRSGEDFVVASHTQLEDMFGRRPKPELNLTSSFAAQRFPHDPDKAGEVVATAGIKNRGRGSAKAPFLDVTIRDPYGIDKYGIDGNYNFGLEPITIPMGTPQRMAFGSSANDMIHSGIKRDVFRIVVKITPDMWKERQPVPDLIIDYKISADGISLIEEQRVIAGQELLDTLRNLAE